MSTDIIDASNYPLTMITLCVIAYDAPSVIPQKVSQVTGGQWECVWGPVALYSDVYVIYSLMYVARQVNTNEFAFVIRGTTADSLTAWLYEDFAISNQVPWSNYYWKAPADAAISQGSASGFKDLLSMEDATRGFQSWLSVLNGNQGTTVYVTGHSLGGTLTPVLAAYIQGASDTYQYNLNVQPYSFAGLTPGNPAFASYIDTLFPPSVAWRYHNSLDVAPFLWNNIAGVDDIYGAEGVNIPFWVKDLLNDMTSGIPAYAQPNQNGFPLTGQFVKYDIFEWELEAMYQHHSTTYQTLVSNLGT